jgi:hypothetical protein
MSKAARQISRCLRAPSLHCNNYTAEGGLSCGLVSALARKEIAPEEGNSREVQGFLC